MTVTRLLSLRDFLFALLCFLLVHLADDLSLVIFDGLVNLSTLAGLVAVGAGLPHMLRCG